MFPYTIFAGLLGLSQIPGIAAMPASAAVASDFTITHIASDYFPHSKEDLSQFDVDVRYTGYSLDTHSWLTSLDPHIGANDEEKARMLTEAAYAKKYDEKDLDMSGDVQQLLAHVAGNTTAMSKGIQKRSTFSTSSSHIVLWHACSAFFDCVSGTSCSFSIDIGKAPRSQCQSQGGSNCCISWSNYNVKAGFFSATWTACNNEVEAEGKTSASCEGYGSSDQGGDVCLSNRASGCT